ncbi:hypothetical protein [Microbacterium sp. WCS2018Hpa-9]|uniref:hypothetical protein n=1 Tax=Microbacterium sp. WCS2018Hpa-9 TaxID=3073635 RepID=UPI00288983A5|nr:hypothetical protein [Microbacterium sp. WCS2018Hpa-9]
MTINRDFTPSDKQFRRDYLEAIADRGFEDLYAAEYDRWVESMRAEAWDAGYEAAARFHEGERGHWEDDSPRKGLRTWRSAPAPENPHVNHRG